jgi:hypothetical protein
MGNLNNAGGKNHLTRDSSPAIVSRLQHIQSRAFSCFANFLQPLPSTNSAVLTQPLEMTEQALTAYTEVIFLPEMIFAT